MGGATRKIGRAGADGQPRTMAARLKALPPGLWMLAALVLVFSLLDKNYFALNNLHNILIQSVPLMILSFAQTLVILTQGVDLSVGAMVSLATVLWVWLAKAGVNIYAGAAAAVLLIVALGVLNGFLVAKGGLPPFIATFGTQNMATSLALLITAGSSIYFYHPIFFDVMETRILHIPIPVIITTALFALTWALLYWTRFGVNIFGLGGNQEALSLAGVSLVASSVKTYAYAAFLAGVCGLIVACRVESGQPTIGAGWEFESIAATILGGTSFREGRGGIAGTMIGVFLLIVLRNGLNVIGISAMFQNAIIGAIVMLAIVIDALVRRVRE